MENEDLQKLKAIELDMLIEFVRVCTRHHLRYFVIGGTCLGAVRHKGFIPWDDDIDIGMPRTDYNKFLEIAQNELPNHLFVQNYKTENDYLLNFTKIKNCNTTFIEQSVSHLDINQGVFIDVFQLDSIPENKFVKKLNNFCLACINLGMTRYYLDNIKDMKFRGRALSYIMKTLYKPQQLHKKLMLL